MIKLLFVFFIFAVLINFSIIAWRALSGKEKWSTVKTILYSVLVSLLAVSVMAVIVILF
jgi:hypothetical protein